MPISSGNILKSLPLSIRNTGSIGFISGFHPMSSLASTAATWQDTFMTALARSKPWVFPGEGDRGLLVRELSWKGRMFGAFTHSEVQYLRTWIDLLKTDDDAAIMEERYWKLVGSSGTITPDIGIRTMRLLHIHPFHRNKPYPLHQLRDANLSNCHRSVLLKKI